MQLPMQRPMQLPVPRAIFAMALLLLFLSSAPSARATRSIANVDGWEAERLEREGIRVAPWRHVWQEETPPREWVQVTFDCAHLPEEQDVVMTAWTVSEGRTLAACRAARTAASRSAVSLVFAVPVRHREQSYLDILVWQTTTAGARAQGYTLSMERIAALAAEREDAGAGAASALPDYLTPLQKAAAGGHAETAAFLIDVGADVNERDVDGRSALHWAAWGGHQQTCKMLVGKGASLLTKDKDGQTPMDLALERGHDGTARFLAWKMGPGGEKPRRGSLLWPGNWFARTDP